MRNIGFSGGSSTKELGTVNDVVLFFECLKLFVEQKYPEQNWHLLTDRLYKRYLRQEEIEDAKAQMEQVRQLFMNLPSSSVEWGTVSLANVEESRLDLSFPMLSDVFFRYFDAFSYCIESAKVNYEEFKSYPDYKYEPVKIVITDMPLYMEDQYRSLEQYDALSPDDPPFWLR
ncbi:MULTISPECIES: hypothetical protein [Photorhabdus]|uniref:Immunity protein 42 n=1 Tax=Photorhabdus aegyptia TaxID=2805098 RepID=A0A022PDR1_9GAMM|nr:MULTISPECIES: hypothetical protein [Photorhabdus]EYU13684.1 Immunity protein 42 [Photorhabdus aegyptia]MBS9422402.1 hypothetical protein [Photorhabdus caribbeanensis]MCC8457970.1 hypothetical protein [Photorhabdus aegyptia]PQQ40658.1 hypothetical protein C6H65_13835 [Photorhabdus luminescens]